MHRTGRKVLAPKRSISVTYRSATTRVRRTASIAVPVLTAAICAMAASSALAAGRPSAKPGWRVLKTVATKNTVLLDVLGFKNGTAWAAGSTASQTPVLYHRAVAGTWTSLALPGGLGSFAASLSATSATNVWAAMANEPDVARLTRHGWVMQPFISGSDFIAADGVATTGPNSPRAVTYDFTTKQATAQHYNRSHLTPTILPPPVHGGGP